MPTLLDRIDPADLIAFARAVPTPSDFLLTQSIVPNETLNNVRFRIRSSTRTRSVAKFRAFDADPVFGKREVASKVTEGMLPPIGQRLVVNELETIMLEIARGSNDTGLLEALYDDAETHTLAIRSRMELAAGDLLTDGKFTLTDENGLTLEADWGVPDANLVAAATVWSASGATPITDELAWRQQQIDAGVGAPGRVVCSNRIQTTLARNSEYRQAYFGTTEANTPSRALLPTELSNVRATLGLPPLQIYDANVYVDGAATRPIPDDRFVMLPSDSAGFASTQYGITAEAISLTRSSNPRISLEQAPGIIITTAETDTPVRVFTTGSAVAMPVLANPAGLFTATVL